MGECKAGHFKKNIVVLNYPLICYGGHGQPPCQYLKECTTEHIKPKVTKKRWENFKDKFFNKGN